MGSPRNQQQDQEQDQEQNEEHDMTVTSDRPANSGLISEPTSAWIVSPASGFTVGGTSGTVPLKQIGKSRFLVGAAFRFDNQDVVEDLVGRMVADDMNEVEARERVEEARTYLPSEEEATDLASIPSFLRWFENSYGCHTLAAVIHDRLICDVPNTGALGSDALADRFFRLMLRNAGVPWLKRWIMWCAVALRSRWAAGGWRRAAIGLWILLALTGITAFVVSVGAAWFDWPAPTSPFRLALFAAVLPAASAPLWGRQFLASMVAATAALWILPAAVFGLIGFGIYSVLESIARRLGFN